MVRFFVCAGYTEGAFSNSENECEFDFVVGEHFRLVHLSIEWEIKIKLTIYNHRRDQTFLLIFNSNKKLK